VHERNEVIADVFGNAEREKNHHRLSLCRNPRHWPNYPSHAFAGVAAAVLLLDVGNNNK
jgi:hypothetical protein